MAVTAALVTVLLSFDSRTVAQTNTHHGDGVLGQTRIWSIHLNMVAAECDAMQPPSPNGPPGAGGQGAPDVPRAAADQRESERNLFGTEFPWARAEVATEGTTLNEVGVRYAGDITYLVTAGDLKRPLKIAFNKYKGQEFDGLSEIELHAMPLDPSKSREALAYSVFQACGVPSPRTAFAEVKLTVPGRFNDAYLGLYTVVEEVDDRFLQRHFGAGDGLAMRPFGIRGVDFLGDSWDRYREQYRPRNEPTPEARSRVIAFAKLVNDATDDEFEQQIPSFIDVEAFLRFMAANALTANLESFLALGHNYTLYLDSKTGKFHFLPGDLEFSMANLLLFGSPDELIDLSVMKPYPGDSRLPDRLLGIKAHHERYRDLLRELSATVFAKERLSSEFAAIDDATRAIRVREQEAIADRPAQPGPLGAPGTMGPPPPDLATFIEKRTNSIAAQLAGTTPGYVPRPFQFGAPPGQGGAGGPGDPSGRGGNAEPINEATFEANVSVPAEFEATLFAAPPKVGYPVAIACEPSGAVYIAVDEQGPLGRTPGGGRIVRCADTNNDCKVDDVTVFAKVDHPRGVTYRDGNVWVMHPPTLSVYRDEDHDGVADREDVRVTGLTTNQIDDRGGDHTTNCVRMGIDGWLYIGVGDYGIKEAKAKDGGTIVLRGGGIVRVRPDGTELEIYCTGLRNPFDVAIDPFLNLFTRDNTNDGAGWDTRVSLLKQSALYGYTQLFANFTDEIMPTLGTFGNSGGTGGLFVQDPRWPAGYRNTLLTGDWGRSEVYRHELEPNGPTFDLRQEVFVRMPRATGMDIDALGRLYVASWYGGEASVYVGPNTGFVARITPRDLSSEPFPDLKKASRDDLFEYLASPIGVTRHHAQGEILARGRGADATRRLVALALDDGAPLEGRVAALFTLKQLDGQASHDELLELTDIAVLREFALRALTDRAAETPGLDPEPFIRALRDPSLRVRAQALISLGRLRNPAAARSILPLTARESGSEMPTARPVQNQPDPGRVVPHLAVHALVALDAVDACLECLDGPEAPGALWALRYLHRPGSVEGLIKGLRTAQSAERRRAILVTLIRLYYREADYEGSWWGIRPDNTGPYFDRTEWNMTRRIGEVLATAYKDGDSETRAQLGAELRRHQVILPGVKDEPSLANQNVEMSVAVPKADPDNPNQIGNLSYEVASARALADGGDAARGGEFFKTQSCGACHTTADGQTPKGPHLLEIGKRYQPAELVESILKPSAKLAQGYETTLVVLAEGRVVQGFVVSEKANATIIRESTGIAREIRKSDVEERRKQDLSSMPEGLVANLTPHELADLIAYLRSLK